MADNGNPGPNDFRSRNGKKRREPPIIDASATEVPIDPAGPETGQASPPGGTDPLATTETEASSGGEPVLFGSATRDPKLRDGAPRGPAAENEKPATDEAGLSSETVMPDPARPVGGVDEPPAADAAASGSPTEADTRSVPDATAPFRATSSDAPPTSRDARSASAPAAARSGALPGVLGVSCLVLLGVIAWLVYAGPRQADRDAMAASLADLKSKVAALEARPDPTQAQSQLQGTVAALDKRVSAAAAERTALGKTVADLNGRLDTVAQQAAAAAKPADVNPDAAPAFASLGAVAALAARVDGLDKSVATLSDQQGQAAKAVADLPKPVAPDFGPVDAKVAALDARVTALDGKLNGTDARFNGFDAKVNGVEGKVNGFDARANALDGRVNAIESKANDALAQSGKLQATVANLPKVDLAPLQTVVAALDGRIVKVEGQLAASKDAARVTEARAVGSADETRATPIALVGQVIEDAIADGRPYGPDLDALKALGAEPDAIAKLAPLAATGAPTPAALKERWEAVEGDVLAVLKPADTSGGGSALDRFAASARNLVQVRRVGATSGGDDASATVLAVDAALNAGDIPGALAAWGKLPAAGQDKSRDWAAAARGQVEAAVAAQAVVGRAIATLGRTKS